MDVLQKAGRHGSYLTQFVLSGATRRYPTRRDMRVAESCKSIERRLVLPLEHHHWMRALEVLEARYARIGRTAEHYQRVLRDMVQQTTPTRANQHSMAQAVHRIRDDAYAGDIPATATLWITLVWAYCMLDQPQTAWECFAQAQRRVHLSNGNSRHVAALLLPVLSQHGLYHEVKQMADIILGTRNNATGESTDAGQGQDSSLHMRQNAVYGNRFVSRSSNSRHDSSSSSHVSDEHDVRKSCNAGSSSQHLRYRICVRPEEVQTVRRCLAEAAARSGDWKSSRTWLRQLQHKPPSTKAVKDIDLQPSCPPNVLFVHSSADSSSSSSSADAFSCESSSHKTMPLCTIDSLFLPNEEAARRTSATVHDTSTNRNAAAPPSQAHALLHAARDARAHTESVIAEPTPALPALSMLSVTAVRALLHACCRDGQSSEARCCWRELYGWAGLHDSDRHADAGKAVTALRSSALSACYFSGSCTADVSDVRCRATPTSSNATHTIQAPRSVVAPLWCGRCAMVEREDALVFMNGLASVGLWRDVLHLFTTLYLGKPGAHYYDHSNHGSCNEGDDGVGTRSSSNDATEQTLGTIALDAAAVNLVFTSLSSSGETSHAAQSVCDAHDNLGDQDSGDSCAEKVTDLEDDGNHTTERARASAGATSSCPPRWPFLFARYRLTPVPRAGMIIRLLDDLLRLREDMCMTDHVMAVVGPALLQQQGELERVRCLLGQSPMLRVQQARYAPTVITPAHRALQSRLVSLVYILHEMESTIAVAHNNTTKDDINDSGEVEGGGGAATAAARAPSAVLTTTMRCFPHVFPPEMFKHLALSGDTDALDSGKTQKAKASSFTASSSSVPAEQRHRGASTRFSSSAVVRPTCDTDLSDEDRLRAQQAARPVSSLRRNRQHYFPPRSTVLLADLQERQMCDNHVTLHERRNAAFDHSTRSVDADPRPIPKGLHDTASGWNFHGRGGEMVFQNSTRTAHPFSMWPKMMRAKGNPYRGWNPRLNSCIAHRENVIKWNGHSSV